MDQNSCYYSSSSSFSYHHQHSQEVTKSKRSSYVNKPIKKPMTKPFIARMAPNPPKVYNVDASNFKEVVRVLTSSSEFQHPSPRCLKAISPPPLDLSTIRKPYLYPKPRSPPSEDGGIVSPLPTFMTSPDFCNFLNETLFDTTSTSKSPETDYFGGCGRLN